MKIMGIDPGLTGALVVLSDLGPINIVDMPVWDGRVDAQLVHEFLKHIKPDVVVVEQTQPMPKNGCKATFSLGMNTGILLGVIGSLGLPMTRLRPQEWKKINGILGRPGKDASRALASELWPAYSGSFKRVKDDGRADAALIARAYQLNYLRKAS